MTATRQIDMAPLHRLLQIAGQSEAPKLVSALLDDLRSAQTNVAQAWNGPDFAALRTNAHVLIALAGTIGDTELHTVAQQISTAAYAQDQGRILDMKHKAMALMSDLIHAMSHLRNGMGG